MAKLDVDDIEFQEAVVWALGALKDERAVEPLLAKLDVDDIELQKAVARALGELKDERAVEPLIPKLHYTDSNLRSIVAGALCQLGHENGCEYLLNLLEGNDAEERRDALGELSKICEREIDRKLLSVDLDTVAPFLDPKEEITEAYVEKVAMDLDISVNEITERYEFLAEKFNLVLAWKDN